MTEVKNSWFLDLKKRSVSVLAFLSELNFYYVKIWIMIKIYKIFTLRNMVDDVELPPFNILKFPLTV